MTITTDRTAMRQELRAFIRKAEAPPFDGKEDLLQARVETELNSILAGFATDEEKMVAINNFRAIRTDFINFMNTYWSETFGQLFDGNNLQPYLVKAIKTIKASLVVGE